MRNACYRWSGWLAVVARETAERQLKAQAAEVHDHVHGQQVWGIQELILSTRTGNLIASWSILPVHTALLAKAVEVTIYVCALCVSAAEPLLRPHGGCGTNK